MHPNRDQRFFQQNDTSNEIPQSLPQTRRHDLVRSRTPGNGHYPVPDYVTRVNQQVMGGHWSIPEQETSNLHSLSPHETARRSSDYYQAPTQLGMPSSSGTQQQEMMPDFENRGLAHKQVSERADAIQTHYPKGTPIFDIYKQAINTLHEENPDFLAQLCREQLQAPAIQLGVPSFPYTGEGRMQISRGTETASGSQVDAPFSATADTVNKKVSDLVLWQLEGLGMIAQTIYKKANKNSPAPRKYYHTVVQCLDQVLRSRDAYYFTRVADWHEGTTPPEDPDEALLQAIADMRTPLNKIQDVTKKELRDNANEIEGWLTSSH